MKKTLSIILAAMILPLAVNAQDLKVISYNIRNSQVEKRKQKKTVQQYTLIAIAGLAALTVAMLVVLTIGGIIGNFLPDNKGPAHEKVFTIEARLNSNIIGRGVGSSKRKAEQNAAREALILFGEKE